MRQKATFSFIIVLFLGWLSVVQPCGTVWARDVYVSIHGTQSGAYDNWAQAFTNLQAALEYADAKTNATIYLAGQTMAAPVADDVRSNNTVFLWKNAAHVALRGGYKGDPADASLPGLRDATQYPTILTRQSEDNLRILTMVALSNCVIEQVTIRGGNFINSSKDSGMGGGVFMSNCREITIQDACISSNTITGRGKLFGGGLCLSGSRARFVRTAISDNALDSTVGLGAGISLTGNSRLTMTRATLRNNTFPYLKKNKDSHKLGGGFYVESGSTLELYETEVCGNVASRSRSSGQGGAGYNSGTLRMRNCLVAQNESSGFSDKHGFLCGGLELGGGAALMENCTIVDNGSNGVRYVTGQVGMTNCIVWGHAIADLSNFPTNQMGKLRNVAYSSFAMPNNMHSVNGCLAHNPGFVNVSAQNYRLSEKPYSPCINRGINDQWMTDATDLADMPRIQDRNVDIGAYEYRPSPPAISHGLASNVTSKTTAVGGVLESSGGAAEAMLLLYHGPDDAGTNRAQWANVVPLPGLRKVGTHSAVISVNQTNRVWCYRFCATNRFGIGWAATTDYLISGVLDLTVTQRESTEERPAAFVISRPEVATNCALRVNFTLGGAGINGVDYDLLESPVIIPAGMREVRLKVSPRFNMGDIQPKLVELTLAPGGYLFGSRKSAKILTRAQ